MGRPCIALFRGMEHVPYAPAVIAIPDIGHPESELVDADIPLLEPLREFGPVEFLFENRGNSGFDRIRAVRPRIAHECAELLLLDLHAAHCEADILSRRIFRVKALPLPEFVLLEQFDDEVSVVGVRQRNVDSAERTTELHRLEGVEVNRPSRNNGTRARRTFVLHPVYGRKGDLLRFRIAETFDHEFVGIGGRDCLPAFAGIEGVGGFRVHEIFIGRSQEGDFNAPGQLLVRDHRYCAGRLAVVRAKRFQVVVLFAPRKPDGSPEYHI